MKARLQITDSATSQGFPGFREEEMKEGGRDNHDDKDSTFSGYHNECKTISVNLLGNIDNIRQSKLFSSILAFQNFCISARKHFRISVYQHISVSAFQTFSISYFFISKF